VSFKYLFIIESPGKLKKIQSFLGSDFLVMATIGHILNLPPNKIGVNIKKDFEPTYVPLKGKESLIKEIKDKASKAEIVYIGTDRDREGEMIAQSVADILPIGTSYKRSLYNAITKDNILKSIEEASEIDVNMVDSAQCRRILDRICGFRTSFITTQATGGKSAGRVQSPALRILSTREKEIKAFVPQEYWAIDVTLEKENGERISTTIKKPNKLNIKTKKMADEICETIKTKDIKVSKYETKETETKAYAPFTTSTMYQSAAAILGWGADRTASVAQQLYEAGSITYIRTDSTSIVPEFIQSMRSNIPTRYGQEYLPSQVNIFSNKKSAQEAHEAVRVTDVGHSYNDTSDGAKLYRIIQKRTFASQMEKMKQHRGNAEFECEEYLLSTSGSKILFDGWYKAWDYGKYDDSELPELEIGEKVKFVDIKAEKKFTQPPPRYTDQSIVKELEKRGIGRPSTYAGIIKLLVGRKYIEKIKKSIHVTDMGIRVSDFLVESDFCFINLDFTADLETKLDEIASQDTNKLNVLNHFWERLKEDIETAKGVKEEKSISDFKCPKCHGNLLIKHSQYGSFFACQNYKNKDKKCDYKADINKETGEPFEKEKYEAEYSDYLCPNCDLPLVVRKNRKGGDLLGCRNWRSKECTGFYNAETGEEIVFKKKKYKKKK